MNELEERLTPDLAAPCYTNPRSVACWIFRIKSTRLRRWRQIRHEWASVDETSKGYVLIPSKDDWEKTVVAMGEGCLA